MALAERFQNACENHEQTFLIAGFFLAIILRCATAFFPYSGEGAAPMFGDFEAQRHWMEITTELPIREWYENTPHNDLNYWGLDYPPLTAYHSLAVGSVGREIVPACFALGSSRGHESALCRVFMRLSVIISDVLVYLPGSYCAVRGCGANGETAAGRVATVLILWLLPSLLLIDHGHFQFNGVCFGLCLAAMGCVARGDKLIGSILFTAGLLYKQIALYYAPAFFFGILGVCLRESSSAVGVVVRVATVGVVVISVVTLAFAPWLLDRADPADAVLQVLHRMFPFARGLYEDKVANFWCSVSIFFKLNQNLPEPLVPFVCAGITLCALLPSNLVCLRNWVPESTPSCSAPVFICAVVCSSFSFFLFAFQVHEKSVLFPTVAACLLPAALGPSRRPAVIWPALCHMVLVSLFSMYPLMVKDRLQWPYVIFTFALVITCECCPAPTAFRIMSRGSLLVGVAIHAIHAFWEPPSRYPDIVTLMFTTSSCVYFLCTVICLTVMQIVGGLFSSEYGKHKEDKQHLNRNKVD